MVRVPFRRSRALRAELAGEASAAATYEAEHHADVLTGVAPDTDHGAEAPPPPVDLTAAAFFDVDNTMMQGASVFHFARGLAARKFFTTGDLVRFAVRQVRFRVGGENQLDMTTVREQALSFVVGRRMGLIVELGEEIYDELMADRIYPGTLALARRHLAAGQRVWLVTATPTELAQIIARRLGLTGALGTVAAVDADGLYTGALVGEMLHGQAKAAAVRALAAREGLDLSRCSAYSDSVNDVPMLSAVGTAVAVNPDGALRDVAREQQWQIVDYRTGRKAARIGVPSLAGLLLAGGLGVAVRAFLRRRRLNRIIAVLPAGTRRWIRRL
ncbi:HAD-IB family hydrolase [Nakamurella flavida]|uniref:HAD-IB family hydrolase n=1 Tax=Nakamurella flavida TaxID=363630 RepID=A0A938YDM4_9ACTN|nr:HAD-IB family hydrolase [Nakamurella flavida]MBM9475746.1 HAD-IB family hydrolase [Nakamurella flavida]MDP9777974.1 HAD superfamily hydrolase (TIGR01490 family) [Nakamurella flavida]